MATTLAPTTQSGSRKAVLPTRTFLWILLAAVTVIGVGLLLAQRIGQSNDAVTPSVAKVAVADTVHGTSGHLVTSDGVPIQAARVASDSDLLVHGGPGSAVTVGGDRLR